MASEFSIIEKYFKPISVINSTNVGIGDDGAVISLPKNKQLVIVTDTSICGVHFPKKTPPFAIGWKSLAVNLSDLAAMGADPAFFSLALSLPAELNNEQWLTAFSTGIKTLADKYKVCLVGGDTTKSTVLSITITAHGWVSENTAILRSTAKAGNLIFVSGNIGDGGGGLKGIESCLDKLNTPEPRVKLGLNLLGLATSAIDISDGLLSDLKHILKASKVSARINYDVLPMSVSIKNYIQQTEQYCFPLTCGDDYELCFTIAQEKLAEITAIEKLTAVSLTCIGEVVTGESANIDITSNNAVIQNKLDSCKFAGFKHFF